MQFSRRMEVFKNCPSCGAPDISFDGLKKLHCSLCSFTYFHNVAVAVAAILEYGKQIMLIKRNNEPSKGKLDLPGGFVDPDETIEEALRREIKEELNMDLGTLKYFGSYPNTYEYEEVMYKTCDLFFSSKIDTLPTIFDKTEVDEWIMFDPSDIPDEQIAFESTKACLRHYRREMA